MSGSRAIVLSLSVRDADVVRQQLVQMGEQGEAALKRLDAAAQRSAGGAGLPAITRATDAATASTGRFSQAVGQAGFQIGDFASQVQGGGSALTALAQQGSQFLGVFGTGGAVAGAVLTVGILAASLLSVGENSEEANRRAQQGFEGIRRASEDLKKIIEEVNDLFLTQEQRAVAARNAVIQNLGARLAQQEDVARQFLEESASQVGEAERQLAEARRRLQAAEREAANARRAGAPVPQDQLSEANAGIFTAQARLDGINADIARQSRVLGEVRSQREQLGRAGGDQGQGQFGPFLPAPERGGRTERPMDVAAIVQRRLDELTRSYDEYNQAVNLSAAGLDRAAPALAEYARQQQLLQSLLDANVISEDEFATEVERTSERLREQIEETQRQTERTGQFANQLGFSFSSAFEDAILKGKSFSDVLKGLEQDIARIIIRSAITAPLGNAIAGGVQSLVGSISFGGARAEGGPVSGGMAYLVGERGPEIVVPRNSGTVIPNERLGGVSFAPTYNIDARGADASMLPRLRAEMTAIAQASVAQLVDQVQRGGSTARVFGRRA